MPAAAIETKKLTKKYDEFVAVDALDFRVGEGEIFGLLGPNGAGKTTTILMLLGLSEPTSGEANVLGLDPTRNPLDIKRLVGYVPDNVGFYSDLSGRQNLRYTAKLNRIEESVFEERITELLYQVGLPDAADSPVGTYSRGMRQRLGIADALVKEPKVLILDEPTIGIDPEGVREIIDLIEKLRDERRVTVLLSSHLLHQIQSVCDRVGIFVKGRMIVEGAMLELARQFKGEVAVEVAVTDWTAAGEAFNSLPGVKRIDREDEFWVIVADQDLRTQIAKALSDRGVALTHLRRRDQGLEEIYGRYFKDADGSVS